MDGLQNLVRDHRKREEVCGDLWTWIFDHGSLSVAFSQTMVQRVRLFVNPNHTSTNRDLTVFLPSEQDGITTNIDPGQTANDEPDRARGGHTIMDMTAMLFASFLRSDKNHRKASPTCRARQSWQQGYADY